MSINPPLRIALLVNSDQLPAWQFRALEKIKLSGDGKVVLAVVRGQTDQKAGVSGNNAIALSLFYRYNNWDRKKFHQTPDPFAEHSLAELDDSIPVVSMVPETTLWCDRLSQENIETLRGYDIDVIVRLGWRILKGDLLSTPRFGVWSFHHGDNEINRGGPPAVWEHYYNQVCTGVTLQILSEKLDNGLVLERSHTATDKSSVSKTRDKLYWRSVDLLPRKLSELRRLGGDAFFERARETYGQISFYSQPLLTEKKMDLKQVLHFIGKNLSAYVKQALFERRFEEKWVLYFKLADELSTSLWQFTKLESPDDRYWADPHVIKKDGTFYVFVEEYIVKTRRGRIAVIPIEEDGTVGTAKTVLAADYHLSYPFIFEHEGTTYMIPESGENKSVDLYKCVGFPDQWEFQKSLIEGVRAVDTTLYEHEGRWWMFTNLCDVEGGNTHDELHLFSASHFLDDHWEPHPQGVIVSDVRRARPAGAIFKSHDKLYRPAQDCSVDYGYALQLHEINELNESCYKETPVSRITPDWNPEVRGVHTLSYVSGMTIVDAKTFIKK